MMNKWLKIIGSSVITLILVMLFVHQQWLMGYQHSLQNSFYDFNAASDQIVIIEIDEESLKDENLGPLDRWPRARYAEAIKALKEAGAKAIGVDLTFPNQSAQGAADDFALASTAREGSDVVLGTFYRFESSQKQWEWPNETLMSTKPLLGSLNVKQDRDGFIRQIPLFSREKETTIEAFSLAIARQYLDIEKGPLVVKDHQLDLKTLSIPTESLKDNRTNTRVHFMNLNYFAEPHGYTSLPMHHLLEGKLADENGNTIDLKDKITLIGPTARDLQDYYLSPVGNGVQMPGVEIHANAIQTIIEERFLTTMPRLGLYGLLILLFLLNTLAFGALKVRWALPLTLIEMSAIFLSGYYFYDLGWIINIIYPLLFIALHFTSVFLTRFIIEQSQRRFVEGAFGHYVNKDLVEEIIKNPNLLQLGGMKKVVTAFFSDIADFTHFSEKLTPEQLTHFLNEYLGEMTQLIMEHKGTLDKYEGDAVMAFWNAPLDEPMHAKLACEVALKQQAKLITLNEKWKAQNWPTIQVRMGIHTGEVIAGNMGAKDRFDYTILGDNVNLASRLEGVNKYYGTSVLISKDTYELIKEYFMAREVDYIKVKGKDQAVQIYELICPTNEGTEAIQQSITQFYSALNLYRQKNFNDAKAAFEKLPQDPVAQVFTKRCATYLQTPPPANWDGAYNFEMK